MAADRTFDRILVANRGEIARRVIRACRELGVSPVAIYSEGEADAVHVRAADDGYLLPPFTSLPYLNVDAIIEIALRSGAQAVHPGYGFLAENAGFAAACGAAGLVFIGPTPEAITAMGDKVEARKIAIAANVPVVPGTDGPVGSIDEARGWADAHGYPVAVKAAAGGGGRGFRVAHTAAELEDAFLGSSGEAARYFANATVYLERYLVRPRHIEVQVFADNHGNVTWLGERDCSVQRRHQKLIEETPSPAVDPDLRRAFGEAATSLARAVDYRGAGTVEFMLAEDRSFYFLEMNTRIQVEHTVTEEVTGIDLVKEQVRVAAGLPLSFRQDQIEPRGHSVQCRINAEDAGRDFKPMPGVVTRFRPPDGPGIRVDSAIEDGVEIMPSFDSLVAKLVTWGRDRDEALDRMARALREFQVEGVPTTIPFHERVIDSPAFREGGPTTAFLTEHPEVIPPPWDGVPEAGAEPPASREVMVEVNGRRLAVRIHGDDFAAAPPAANGSMPGRQTPKRSVGAGKGAGGAGSQLVSPIQGTVLRVPAEPGATVAVGDLICVVEAMKMENEIAAHRAGTVKSLGVEPGATVRIGAVICEIE